MLPAIPKRYHQQEDYGVILNEIRDSISLLHHESDNHESEIRMLSEKINNQEATLLSLRQQLLDSNVSNKELVKGNNSSLDTKLQRLEAANKNLVSDLKEMRAHANETAIAYSQGKQRIEELEKIIQAQAKNMEHFQAAMHSLTDLLAVKEGISSDGTKVYFVKTGDNLEKIAKAHQTTVKVLKEINKMTNDKIVIGQKVLLP